MHRRWFSAAAFSRRNTRAEVSPNVSLNVVITEPAAPTKSADGSARLPLLLLPGAFGSVEYDFRRQFDAFGHHMTVIGVDPRGYSKSRPPARDFPDKYFERDAEDIVSAMDKLGYDKFSVLGFSAGANTAAVLAAKIPEKVDRLVLVSGNAFVTDEDIEAYEAYGHPSKWHPELLAQAEAVYGEELHEEMTNMLDKLRAIRDDDGDLYCGWLPQIKSKTLVITGEKDKLVADFHGEYLNERIMHSRLHVIANGRHDVQASHADEFNRVVLGFLDEADDKLTQSREFVARPAK
ncbi:TPA: hypothetical protein N0F65_013023 [Lagenidium giganteum]|uniref:AB hydrolase-1 domain-containing protein n=1 Tax=Lagenidium giganteum TaxID=4803 RepID=A0AAV2YPZ3_9STRA|nr:TPA: hypothetical protein N0F65_013023 [Lagenidium giganteum]